MRFRYTKYAKGALIVLSLVLIVTGGAVVVILATSPTPGPVQTPNATSTPALGTGTTTQTNSGTSTTASKPYSATGAQNSVSPDFSTATLLTGMKMTFDDEFNTFSRYTDLKGDITCNPGGKGTWQTVYSFCSRTNPGNGETEVYIDPGFLAFLKKETVPASETDSDNPFAAQGGVLSIKAMPSSQQVISAVGPWAKYTSGMITTQYSFTQTYGYFEMRAKFPAGRGLWPAFWLLPADRSWPPEIDALESFGAPNPKGEGGPTMIHYGSHALKDAENCGGWYNVGVDITKDFHTYGVDIEPTGITYFFDGRPYAKCPANSGTNKPFYMVVNLAVGADWPGAPDSSNSWPAYMYIDYVRAYQKI